MRYSFLRAFRQPTPLLAVAALLVLGARLSPLNAQGATVSGFVRDTLGLAISGVEVTVEGTSLRATTDPNGSYRIEGVALGNVRLRIRRLGFRPTTMDVEIGAHGVSDVEIQLVQLVQQLAPVSVMAQREAFESRLSGFYERKERKVGHFISRERIERTHSFSLTDALRDVPGVKIRPIGPILKAVRIRGASCPPLVFIDGAPATAAEFDLESIDLGMVEGIEVYSGTATVPAEFAGPRNLDRCGVVAVWSRPFRPRPRPPTTSVNARTSVDLDRMVSRGDAFTATTVDSAASLLEGGLAPEYPVSLWKEKRSGRVLTEFVVDTSGGVVAGTIGIIASTHPLFSLAARDALAQAQFQPAWRHGALVRQVVQLPIEFVYPSRP